MYLTAANVLGQGDQVSRGTFDQHDDAICEHIVILPCGSIIIGKDGQGARFPKPFISALLTPNSAEDLPHIIGSLLPRR